MHNYQQLNLKNKNKLSKQLEQEQNLHMEIPWRVIVGWGKGVNGEKGTGNKKHKWQVQNRQGEVKNSMGNGEAKEIMYMNMN